MSEGFSENIIVLTDEEGVEHEFEHLDTIELNEKIYMAFIPAGTPEDIDEPVELTLLRADTDENGEEILSSIEDEDELEMVYNAFLEEAEDEDEIQE